MSEFVIGPGTDELRREAAERIRRAEAETKDCHICHVLASESCVERPGFVMAAGGYHGPRHRRFRDGW